jgi:hypothetical protein
MKAILDFLFGVVVNLGILSILAFDDPYITALRHWLFRALSAG